MHRSSHLRCSVTKGVLRNVAKFTGKYLCQSLFFNKVEGLRLELQASDNQKLGKVCKKTAKNFPLSADFFDFSVIDIRH